MIAFTLIIVVLGMSVPSFKNAISNLAITRLSSIAIILPCSYETGERACL
jgi:hypothetical protein